MMAVEKTKLLLKLHFSLRIYFVIVTSMEGDEGQPRSRRIKDGPDPENA